ncbi:hypothetical protein [Nocardia xishanensis]
MRIDIVDQPGEIDEARLVVLEQGGRVHRNLAIGNDLHVAGHICADGKQ